MRRTHGPVRLLAVVLVVVGGLGAGAGSARAAAPPVSQATPVAVASSTASAESATALSVPAPSGVGDGDLLLASIAVGAGAGASVTAPPGWTMVPGAEAEITATGVRTETYYRFARASSPDHFTFRASGGSGRSWDGVITDFDGADDVSPVEVAAAQVDMAPSNALTAPSITPTAADSTLVFVGVGAPTATWTAPPGMTEQAAVSGSGVDAIGETVASETGLAATATGSVSAETGMPAAAGAGVLIALASDSPALAGSSAASATAAASLSIDAPSGVAPGDLLLAAVLTEGGQFGSMSAPSGWTEVPNTVAEDGVTSAQTVVYEKLATAAEPTSYTFTSAAAVPEASDGIIVDVKNPNPGAPIDAAAAEANVSSSNAITAPSVSTTEPDTTLVTIDAAEAPGGWTPPPGMTERAAVGEAGGPPVALTVASEPWQPANATGPQTAIGAGPAASSVGVQVALSSTSAQTPPSLSTTGATNVSSGNATLGTTVLSRCANGCRAWTRWRPTDAGGDGPWTTGASAGDSGGNVFEAYDLAASERYEYEVCDNLAGTLCYGARATHAAAPAGAPKSVSTFSTLGCAAARGHYGQSLTTATVNFGAMPSYTCPPFAEGGAPTAWGDEAPRRDGTPDPPRLDDSATMVKDILTGGLDNLSVGRDSTGWPVYYSNAGDPVYRIVCGGTCPAATTVHLPPGAQPEDDSDHHLTIIDQSTDPAVEYDMWEVTSISPRPCAPCVIRATNAGRDPVDGDSRETGADGVGADAAHDALQAGVLRAEELFGDGFDEAVPQGLSIRHAIAISVPCTAGDTDGDEIFPAAGNDGTVCPRGETDAPEMGQRFVLSAPIAQIRDAPEPQWKKNLLLALAFYGAIVVDTNGPANGTSIRYQNDLSYELPDAAAPVWGDPWLSFAAANDDGTDITAYGTADGPAPKLYSLNFANDSWFQNELRRYLVAVKPCVSLGDCS